MAHAQRRLEARALEGSQVERLRLRACAIDIVAVRDVAFQMMPARDSKGLRTIPGAGFRRRPTARSIRRARDRHGRRIFRESRLQFPPVRARRQARFRRFRAPITTTSGFVWAAIINRQIKHTNRVAATRRGSRSGLDSKALKAHSSFRATGEKSPGVGVRSLATFSGSSSGISRLGLEMTDGDVAA